MAALRVWRALVGASVRAQLQYRSSLVIEAVAGFGITFLDFIAVLVLFRHFPRLDGWSVEQVAFLYGLAGTGFAFADLVLGHIEDVNQLVRTGRFDALLLRPAGTLTQVVGSDFAIRRVGKIAQALIILIWAATRVHVHWQLGTVALCIASVVSAAGIFAAIWIAGSCVQFFVLGAGEISNGMTYGGNFLSQYPVSIYGPWLRRLLAYVVPIAFVAYLPASTILRTNDSLQLPRMLGYLSPVVAVVSLVLARLVWQFSVRHYRSTGS
jgi:ABC-2 type transport system permease protein